MRRAGPALTCWIVLLFLLTCLVVADVWRDVAGAYIPG